MESPDAVLTNTLEFLYWRLQRLEFLLGKSRENEDEARSTTDNISTRVRRLEQSMQLLARNSDVVSELLQIHTQCPEVFTPKADGNAEPEPSTTEKLAMVISEAPSFTSTASQLRHLSDIPLPPSSAFAKLTSLQPRMERAQSRQLEHAAEVSRLRKESGRLVLRWHENFILGQGKCWVDWDSRLREAEKIVRREEVRRSDDAKG